ncbi:response regulator transcription factor [Novosphingobium flavum]|uniref:Response regulator transcription factor n=1 Tax=Novosphingobium flavum TaxID=1778672 RepID=A0A7X1FPA9_9SPHN|nr:response regulator transcription factor [Novosphingobium flavum]MBC2664067.1 response regulator transcription factor [Novosphingobium flavum]
MKVAILDDEPAVRAELSALLSPAGFECSSFGNGRAFMRALHRETFELFVIDGNLPDLPGINVVEWIRNQIGGQPPIMLLTRYPSDDVMVAALRAGADLVVAKPFQPPVLLAKLEALARRSSSKRSTESFGAYEFDLTSKGLRKRGDMLHITPKEFNLALLLFRNLNRAVSRTYILETIWGIDPDLSTRTLDIHVSKIRAKLGLKPDGGFRLAPVYGYGYRLEELRA